MEDTKHETNSRAIWEEGEGGSGYLRQDNM